MASLSNYLRIHRKRLSLSQEEVAFLLGARGLDKGSKVCRDENFAREPSLQAALAYEVIYGKSVRELFAGLHAQVEREVVERAGVLRHRKIKKSKPKREEAINRISSKLTF